MDPFEVLGLRPGASQADVRQAFAAAVRRVHPDAGAPPSGAADNLARLMEARDRLLGVYRPVRPVVPAPVTVYHRARGFERLMELVARRLPGYRPEPPTRRVR